FASVLLMPMPQPFNRSSSSTHLTTSPEPLFATTRSAFEASTFGVPVLAKNRTESNAQPDAWQSALGPVVLGCVPVALTTAVLPVPAAPVAPCEPFSPVKVSRKVARVPDELPREHTKSLLAAGLVATGSLLNSGLPSPSVMSFQSTRSPLKIPANVENGS